jgi:anthranilate phosphoribosyltransferase
MKTVGPIRKELGVKTFFNMLGPLVNPAQPKVQMSGVFSLELARMYHYILQNEDSNYSIIFGLDGFDEITLTDKVKIIQNNGESILEAADFKLPKVNYDQLFGGNTVEEATEIFNKIINGNGSASQNNVVLANAALAIQTYHQHLDFQAAYELATASLFELKAKQSLTILTAIR